MGAGGRWRIWIDTGGTFTDALGLDPGGRLRRAKVLTSGRLRGRVAAAPAPDRIEVEPAWDLPSGFFAGLRLRAGLGEAAEVGIAGWEPATAVLDLVQPLPEPLAPGAPVEIEFGEEAPVVAARLLTRTPPGRPFPPAEVRLATTRGTNALLERRGAATALFVTRGFGDLLSIGTQQRPELFARAIERPPPLHRATVEVDERLDARGRELVPLDAESLRPAARALVAEGVRSAAVALMHSYRDPGPERRVGDLLREAGFERVSLSAELVPRIRILPRAETAVVDAYLGPVLREYLEAVEGRLASRSLHVMTSAGGLVAAAEFSAKDSLLSGPAGGVVGAVAAAGRSGRQRVLAFDMGGTSTDVSRSDGELEYVFETRVGAARLLAPALAIETVAAGGGSICRFDGLRLRVGPESAGADPGPACYGAGGPLCLTDVNLLLGRLDPRGPEIPIDPEAARHRAEDLKREVGGDAPLEEMLDGLRAIADERMAAAVRQISIRRGYRPEDYTLVAFGGAGGQHACSLADLLGGREVLLPRDAGLLSALGLGAARIERFAVRQVLRRLEEVEERLDGWLDELARSAWRQVEREGAGGAIEVRLRRVDLRLEGQDATLAVVPRDGRPLAELFAEAYLDHYGYRPAERPIEVESLRVAAAAEAPAPLPPPRPAPSRHPAEPDGECRMWSGGRWRRVPRYRRDALRPGAELRGPALVVEAHATTVVDAGWWGGVDGAAALALRRRGGADG